MTLRDVPAQVGSLLVPRKPRPGAVPAASPRRLPAADRERLRGEAGRVFAGQVEPALRKLRDYLADTYLPRRSGVDRHERPARTARPWYA